MPLSSNSTFRNWLVRDRFLLLGQEAKGRSQIGLYGQLFDAEDSAVTARGHGADLDLSPKDRVSVMHESVSKVSVIGKGSKRARMRASGLFRSPVTMATMIIAVVVMMVGSASAAAAGVAGPGWELSARSYPTSVAPAHRGALQIEVFNVGAGSSTGEVTVTDTLPAGVTATEAGEYAGGLYARPENVSIGHARWNCSGNGTGDAPKVVGASVVTCRNDPTGLPSLLGGAGNTGVNTEGNAQIAIAIQVAPDAPEEPGHPGINQVAVAGGGAPSAASTTDAIVIGSAPTEFEFTNFDVWFSNADGSLDTQAGSHPYAATFNFGIPANLNSASELTSDGHEPRNVAVELPPGLIGDPTAVPQCARTDFIAEKCSPASQVGIVVTDTFSGFFVKRRVYDLAH